jgi:four helix bundle protein
MKLLGYRSLAVWRRSRALAIEVYRVTASGAFRGEWAIRDQIRRSALSVPSNIAEGSARGSDPDRARFYLFARGSLAELSTQADIAAAVGLLDAEVEKVWQSECGELGAMLTGLIARKALGGRR